MSRTPARTAQPKSEHGANLIEMAILVPLLLLLIYGVADLGRAFYAYITLTNATREGARLASQYPFTDNEDDIQEIVERVQGEPAVAGAPWADVTVVTTGLGGLAGDPITVTATLQYPTFLGQFFGLEPLTLSSEASMRIFGITGMTTP